MAKHILHLALASWPYTYSTSIISVTLEQFKEGLWNFWNFLSGPGPSAKELWEEVAEMGFGPWWIQNYQNQGGAVCGHCGLLGMAAEHPLQSSHTLTPSVSLVCALRIWISGQISECDSWGVLTRAQSWTWCSQWVSSYSVYSMILWSSSRSCSNCLGNLHYSVQVCHVWVTIILKLGFPSKVQKCLRYSFQQIFACGQIHYVSI